LTVLGTILFQHYVGIIEFSNILIISVVLIIINFILILIDSKNKKIKTLEDLFKDYKGDYLPGSEVTYSLDEVMRELKTSLKVEEEKEDAAIKKTKIKKQ
jgi:hypothetical protein